MSVKQRAKASSQSTNKPSPQRRLAPAARQRQLLECALEAFVAKGYQGATMADIAEAAGVSRAIVYNHFGSLDGAYTACLAQARGLLDGYIGAHAARAASLEERVLAGIEGYFEFLERETQSWRLLYSTGTAVAGSSAAYAQELRFATVERISHLFQPFAGSEDPMRILLLSHALSGAGEQLGKFWLANPHLPRAQITQTMFQMVWVGLSNLFGSKTRSRVTPKAAARSRP